MAESNFSDDYATARDRFREASVALGWEMRSYPIDLQSPNGDDLTIDVAVTPGDRTRNTLVLSSGLHGVEGFLGSAVQLALLRKHATRGDVNRSIRLVLVHGLNPFGFAWRRRPNEANVDLNRNFLLAGESFRGSPQNYPKLDRMLNPKRPPSRWEPVSLKILLTIMRYGLPALKQAVAFGQYDFPQGLFYGGDRPSRTSEILGANLDEWLGDSRKVVHIDFHTGLGKWASHKLLVDYPLDQVQRQRLSDWFGPDSLEGVDVQRVAYAVRGSIGKWCVSRNAGRDYMYVAAEFGTYRVIQVLAGLRAENQAHHWCRPEDASTEQAKRHLVELFCPRAKNWRIQVLQQSDQIVQQAINGLAGW